MNDRNLRRSRDLSKFKMDDLKDTACTVAEATQIAFAAAHDVVENYTESLNKVVITQTIIINTLTELMKSNGISQEVYEAEYKKQAESYLSQKKEYLESLVKKAGETDG